jgi:hypothetical protein
VFHFLSLERIPIGLALMRLVISVFRSFRFSFSFCICPAILTIGVVIMVVGFGGFVVMVGLGAVRVQLVLVVFVAVVTVFRVLVVIGHDVGRGAVWVGFGCDLAVVG